MQFMINVNAAWLAAPAELARILELARSLESAPGVQETIGRETPHPPRQFGEGLDDTPRPRSDRRDDREAKRFFGWLRDQDLLGRARAIGERRGFPKRVVDWSPTMIAECRRELDREPAIDGHRNGYHHN